MAGNPKDSKWYNTPQSERKRKQVKLSLSDEAREKLKRLGDIYGSQSEAAEQLILAVKE